MDGDIVVVEAPFDEDINNSDQVNTYVNQI